MGGVFVNYFNLFGRVWQVYVQAEGEYRTTPENVGQFRVRNAEGQAVPLSTLMSMKTIYGPEFTIRFNGYRAAQINGSVAPGYSTGQAMAALEQVFAETMPSEMGYDYMGMSFQEKTAAQGVTPERGLRALTLSSVSHLGSAVRELDVTVQCASQYADRGLRRISGALAARVREQCVYPDRPDHAHWASG